MRLPELDPRWLEWRGRRVGMIFRCPHCRSAWLSCMFEATPVMAGAPCQVDLFAAVLGEGAADDVVPCRKDVAWKRDGDDFATMTVAPSIDASASGHWHGSIARGECR